MFKIGDFSKLVQVSVRMLRYYDEAGLVTPRKIDDFTGYRYYTAIQISRINRIVALRNMGFNVAEIVDILGEVSEEKVKARMLEKKATIIDAIAEDEHKIEMINASIEDFAKERIRMEYHVEFKTVPTYQVIALREIIPTYAHEGMLWEKLGAYITKKSIPCQSGCFATYYDEGYKDSDVDVEVVNFVEQKLESEEGFVFKDTEAIESAASILVPGDFSNIAPAFQFLGTWIEEQGYTICGRSRQIPIKGPWNEESVEDYLTEIQIPVCKLD